jgi:hypothetical protein
MKKAEKASFRLVRRTGIVLTFLAWGAFLVSFFLPTAKPIESFSTSEVRQSGWQTFVDSLTVPLSEDGLWSLRYGNPLVLMCLLSPLPNALALFAPLVILRARQYGAFYGAFLLFTGMTALVVCMQVCDGISAGFYVWIASIFVTALASFLIAGSYAMEDNAEHDRMLAELQGSLER